MGNNRLKSKTQYKIKGKFGYNFFLNNLPDYALNSLNNTENRVYGNLYGIRHYLYASNLGAHITKKG